MEKHKKRLAIVVYLHSQSQRFFVDVSFKFSNNRCMYTAYNMVISRYFLSLMQCLTVYLFTLQYFDF